MKAYESLVAESEEHGMPLSYSSDLTEHDRKRLEGNDAPPVFGWVLRELGTYILDPRMQRENIEFYLKHLEDEFHQGNRYYWWNGRQLLKLGFGTFSQRLREHNRPSNKRQHDSY